MAERHQKPGCFLTILAWTALVVVGTLPLL
jgi:hypothetical protein